MINQLKKKGPDTADVINGEEIPEGRVDVLSRLQIPSCLWKIKSVTICLLLQQTRA